MDFRMFQQQRLRAAEKEARRWAAVRCESDAPRRQPTRGARWRRADDPPDGE